MACGLPFGRVWAKVAGVFGRKERAVQRTKLETYEYFREQRGFDGYPRPSLYSCGYEWSEE